MIGRIVLTGVGVVALAGVGAAIFFKEEIKKAIKQAQLDTEAAIAQAKYNRVARREDAELIDVMEAKCGAIYADMKAAFNRF